MPGQTLSHTRVTRNDWLQAARQALVTEGIDRVKIAVLAAQLGVARSSFYWYFTDRKELTDALLAEWEVHNTASIIERAARPADTVTGAILAVFECWADPALFDPKMEFAVREWARRDEAVRARLAIADEQRIGALTQLHRRFGLDEIESVVRARVHYHAQIGMYALGVDEATTDRLRLLPAYVSVFTGVWASPEELAHFGRWVATLAG